MASALRASSSSSVAKKNWATYRVSAIGLNAPLSLRALNAGVRSAIGRPQSHSAAIDAALAQFSQGCCHIRSTARRYRIRAPAMEITHVDKCVACQYYDRQMAKPTDTRGVQWGQCRRTAPMLHPINAKSYMIEGVWPHVRDDDWCGEWKVAQRPLQVRPNENAGASPLHANVTPASTRPSLLSSLASGNTGSFPITAAGALSASGRGD
jgi:hypothetical protein